MFPGHPASPASQSTCVKQLILNELVFEVDVFWRIFSQLIVNRRVCIFDNLIFEILGEAELSFREIPTAVYWDTVLNIITCWTRAIGIETPTYSIIRI